MSNYGPSCTCRQEGCEQCFPDPDDVEAHLIGIQIKEVKTIAEKFLLEWFGPRCEEYDENCELCLRWVAMDMLVDNPWGVDE